MLTTSSRMYEVDRLRSALLRLGDGEPAALEGCVVFDDDDDKCSLRLWTSGDVPVRFNSWRFRRIAGHEYWVPGMLVTGGHRFLVTLRLYGPLVEGGRPMAVAVGSEMALHFHMRLVERAAGGEIAA